jgi:hypothetical protein
MGHSQWQSESLTGRLALRLAYYVTRPAPTQASLGRDVTVTGPGTVRLRPTRRHDLDSGADRGPGRQRPPPRATGRGSRWRLAETAGPDS